MLTRELHHTLEALVSCAEDVQAAVPETIDPDDERTLLAACAAQQRTIARLIELLTEETA